MSIPYNLYNLEPQFKNYLLAGNKNGQKMTPVSVKNYLSDFRHFAGWLSSLVIPMVVKGSLEDNLTAFLTTELIHKYKEYLASNNLPIKSINRRLSTVRKFCSFCISQGWIKENPAKKVMNVRVGHDQPEMNVKMNHNSSTIVTQFGHDSVSQNVDLEDIKEFLTIINS